MGKDEKWYRKQRTQRTCMYNPWTCTKGGMLEGWGVQGRGGINGENLEKLIISIKILKK